MKPLMKKNSAAQRTAIAGMLIAVGILLPLVTSHGFGVQGTVLLPMHMPVFLIGFLCGPLYGALCGLIIPALSSVLTGMPAAYPMLPIMMGELFTYGLVSGLLYEKTPLGQTKFGVYPALLGAMLCGKAVYAGIFELLLLSTPNMRALSVTAAFVTGLPGIVIQLVLIPAIVTAVRGVGGKKTKDAVVSAVNLIKEGTASCVLVKDGQIVKTAVGSGIKPLMNLLDEGALAGVMVVDKIIGKAAAMILVKGGATSAYGDTMSVAARDYLTKHHIKAECGRCIDVINNRQGNGICPMERTVMDIDEAEDGIAALRETMAALSRKQA